MTRYIHIEGVDLSGKTSVSKAVAAMQPHEWNIRAASLSDAPNPLRKLTDDLCEQGIYGNDTIGLAYAAALKADMDTFVQPEIDTIQESTILLRSLAYHAINGNHAVLRVFEELAPHHPTFDHSFMLTASRDARLARLAGRAHNTDHDLLIVRDPGRFFRMEDCIKEYSEGLFGTTTIDTTDMTIDEVAAYINQQLTIEGTPHE